MVTSCVAQPTCRLVKRHGSIALCIGMTVVMQRWRPRRTEPVILQHQGRESIQRYNWLFAVNIKHVANKECKYEDSLMSLFESL